MQKRTVLILVLASVVIGTLQGCATAVVGGVATGASVIHDRRATGVTLEDQNIELKAMHLRLQDKELRDHTNISATSYNLVLLLTGQAETEMLRERHNGIASRIPQVKRVVNEVAIAPSATIGEQSGDTYLTSKVKVKLFSVKIPEFDPTRVKVVSEQGTVYLMGLLTQQEADAVVEVVRYVSGVRRVVKVFEYVTPDS